MQETILIWFIPLSFFLQVNDFEQCKKTVCIAVTACTLAAPHCTASEVLVSNDKYGCAQCKHCVTKIEAASCGSTDHPWGSDPQCVCSERYARL